MTLSLLGPSRSGLSVSALMVALAALGAGCSSSGSKSTAATGSTTTTVVAASTTTAAAPTSTCAAAGAATSAGSKETNPPGDIPDNQVFVAFTAPGGNYSMRVPEGWARADTGTGADTVVKFTDKFNTVAVQLTPASSAPSTASATSNEVPTIASTATCYESGTVTAVTRKGGHAVRITYRADSSADAVTGKVVRQDVERDEFWKAGTEAVITLSAPAGSDNVDPWRLVTDSFAWK